MWSAVSFWMPLIPRRVGSISRARPICFGAIRLPHTAFRQNVTDVTTDIVFFNGITAKTSAAGIGVYNGDGPLWTISNTEGFAPGRHQQLLSPESRPDHRQNGVFDAAGMRKELFCITSTPVEFGPEIVKRLEALRQTASCRVRKPALNTEVRVRNADFIRSPYFSGAEEAARCAWSRRARKIAFKVASAFGESDYDILPVKNDTARLRLACVIQIRDTLRGLLNEEKRWRREPDDFVTHPASTVSMTLSSKSTATSIPRPIVV